MAKDFKIKGDGILVRYTGDSKDVVIPDGVTSIGNGAFRWCRSLTSVTIPNSVTSIGDEAFFGCSSLKSVTIPDSVTSIDDEAFFGCSSLKSVTIPDSVTSIDDEAFSWCSSLTSVTIPNSVTSIGNGAFRWCRSLTSVTIPNNVTSIGDGAFHWCSSLKSVTIPNSVTSIGYSAFEDCGNLESVVIPDSVTNIGKSAFSGCSSLISVTIPDSVTSIGEEAFSECSGLSSLIIPDGVVSIGSWAFRGCGRLTSVTIPDSVIRLGTGVFSECISLNHFDVNEKYKAEDGMLFFEQNEEIHLIMCYDGKQENLIPEGTNIIGSGAFSHSSLENIVIPDSVTSIGDYAFYKCSSLKNVVIPDSVTSIGDYAFSYCRSLTSVIIPASVTSIGKSAFNGCSRLPSVVISASVTSIGDSAFCRCSSLKNVSVLMGADNSTGYKFLTKNTFESAENINSFYAPSIPLSHLKSEGFGMIAAKTFISKSAGYKDPSIRDEYLKYISSQRKKLLPDIFKRDDVKIIMLLADAKKITKKNIEEDYLLPAMQYKAKECAAYLGSLLEELTGGKMSKDAVNISGRELWDGIHFSIDGKKMFKYEDKEGQTEYYVPEGTREIDPHAFNKTNLERIYLPESVKIIRDTAFSVKKGRNLYVFFPGSLKTVSRIAFDLGGVGYAFIPNAEIVDKL